MSPSEYQTAGQPETSPDILTPAALHDAGLQHLRAGRNLDAQLCCQQSLGIDQNHADTLHLMGLLCLAAKQHDHAVEWISRAIRQVPKAEYLTTLGTALREQGRHEDALKAFDKAVQLKPEIAELWKNLGNILVDLKRPDDALLSFQHALKLSPRLWYAANQSAVLLYNANRFEEALDHLDRCIEQQPDHVPSLQLRALSLKGLKRYEEALAQNHRAYDVDPNDADTCNNIGDILHMLDRFDEALSWFDLAIARRPGYILTINNKAFLLGQMHRFDEAFAIYEGLQRDGLNTPVTNWNLSLLYMLTGNFEAGWPLREARWHAPVLATPYPNFEQPMWLGENIAGKTILIHADEGLGDCIQFARYIPEVAALGARVILVVAQPIESLLARLPGVSACLPLPGGPLPAFDLHCPLSSLPLAFKTRLDTIPSAHSYLPPPPEAQIQAWENRLGRHDKLRIGLVWSGNPAHGNDRNRSMALRGLSRILDVDATFVSLQKNPKPDDQATLLEHPEIIDLTADLADFCDTAALVSCLDLVITVDTSVAHLAAALGRPTWILLPFTPDYRWLLERDDSPWYPTARLFRQSIKRDYGEVLDRVRDELTEIISPSSTLATSAVGADADSATSIYDLGLRHMRAGRTFEARSCCERALALDRNNPDALHLSGVISLQAHDYDHAIEKISRAIQQSPKAEYLSSLAATLRHQSRFEDAEQVLKKAIQLKSADAELWSNLGDIQIELNRLTDALSSFRQALKFRPDHWNAANGCGIILHAFGRMEEAVPYFDLCDSRKPNHPRTLHMRAMCLCSLRGLEATLPEIRRAQALDPADATMPNDVGVVLQSLGQDDVALDWFGQALAIRPDFADAFHNKAVSLARVHRFDEAIAVYEHLNTINPNDVLAHLGRAHLQLLAGDFEAGWAGREVRRLLPSNYPNLPQPMWLGNSALDGKTILVGADEGLGDTIQFARYVPLLAARGAKVVFVVQESLHSLMSDVPGVAQCISIPADALPAFDMHCPIMSLPLAFGTTIDTIPAPSSYLPRPAEARMRAWESRLDPRARLRVGLVWCGNPKHKNDRNRSVPLRALTRILDLDATFVSLQKEPRPADKAILLGHPEVIDLTVDLADFAETAALVCCLDLVIAVDTSVAHLAAALGRPTWILLPHTPDYRWLLDRDDSPWYPTARLFRQSAKRDYGEVLDRVRTALTALVAARQTG